MSLESKALLLKITGAEPRVGLGAIIVNPKGEILMCRRGGPSNYLGKLHLFGGKLDLGETMRTGIIREVLEETDINAELNGNKIVQCGMIEEIEPHCSYFDDESQKDKMYHWISSVWQINVQDNYFKNVEPHKHYDMDWYDLSNLNFDVDLAPSAIKSLTAGGFIFRNLNTKFKEKACV